MRPPANGQDWVGLSASALPVTEALAWATTPDCGAQVLFTGTVRDHAEGRTGVTALEYEAYEGQVEPRLRAVCDEARARWPELGRLVLLHRTGPLALTEVAVVVVAAAPHRGEAFAGARFCIDALKASAPIWKKETWSDGSGWGTDAADIAEVRSSC